VKLIYFQKIRLKKIKDQNTKNWPKLFLKLFKIDPNRNPKKAKKRKEKKKQIGQLLNMQITNNNHI
jgi:hypothetical protein